MDDIYVYIIRLPKGISEMVMPCADGGYTVYINSRLSQHGKNKAFLHALRHIENNDWEKTDVQEIEKIAHREVE